jgi:hypothetical protein
MKGQRRGESGGNYADMETGESFWVSSVKKARIAIGLGPAKSWSRPRPCRSISKNRHRHSRQITLRGHPQYPLD